MIAALTELAKAAWTEEAKNFARGTLSALSDSHEPESRGGSSDKKNHIMVSYRWDHQRIVQRISLPAKSRIQDLVR